jgi:FSR family fosmidomycin resistance protein-like MFS transporter
MLRKNKPMSVLWAVSLGHLSLDMFNGIIAVLLVFISAHIVPLTNTQIGLAIGVYQISGSLAQPLFGLMGDRTGGRWLGALGVAWTISLLLLGLVVIQVTGQFVLMLLIFVIAPMGSAAFHPVGAMHASDSSSEREASHTAIFFLAGQTGLALGPALAGILLDRAASHNNVMFANPLGPIYAGKLAETGTIMPVFFMALLAIPAVIFMAFALPNRQVHADKRKATIETVQVSARLAIPVQAMVFLVAVVALRSLSNPGSVAFIPRLFELRGWDAAQYGAITGFFWIGSGVAGLLFGMLADRFESRYVVAITLLLAAIPIFLLTILTDTLAFVMALGMGVLSGGSHSLLVIQAQRLIPGRKGLASGSIMGFMFATGALGTLVIGGLGDMIGLPAAFQVVAVVTAITGVLALGLQPDRKSTARIQIERDAEVAAISGAD